MANAPCGCGRAAPALAEMNLPSGGDLSGTEARLRALKERVDRVHRASALPIRCGVAPLPAGLPDGSLLSSVARHDLQHQGIIEQMRGGGLLSPELTFVDFGAGDGGLCRCVACAAGGGRYVLVDRSRRPTMPAVGVHEVNWLRADVSTLLVPDLQRAARGECVVVSNHLCGSALDLAVSRSVAGFHLTKPARLLGVMAATCCHDQCSWESFLGQVHHASVALTPVALTLTLTLALTLTLTLTPARTLTLTRALTEP